jgi:hypothetical protein
MQVIFSHQPFLTPHGGKEMLRIFADFHNADSQGRLRLNCIGTIEDLTRQQISLQNAQWLTLYSEDLEVDGVVQYSAAENLWVAVIDWDEIREPTPYVSQTKYQLHAVPAYGVAPSS